jgi:hypothetical protein
VNEPTTLSFNSLHLTETRLTAGAQPGAVVCFYPGVVYRPMHYRLMANFPRVDLTNPYLIGRFDGSLVDGKPWGYAGGDTGGTSFYPWGAMPVAARGSSGATHRPGFMERLVKFGSSMGQVRRLSARGAVCADRKLHGNHQGAPSR